MLNDKNRGPMLLMQPSHDYILRHKKNVKKLINTVCISLHPVLEIFQVSPRRCWKALLERGTSGKDGKTEPHLLYPQQIYCEF